MSLAPLEQSIAASSTRHPLDRLLSPLPTSGIQELDPLARGDLDRDMSANAVVCLRGTGEPTWLTSGGWRVLARPADVRSMASGDEIASFDTPEGDAVCAWHDRDRGGVLVSFSLAEAYENYISEAWKSEMKTRQLSARQLQLFYAVKRVIPRPVQVAARRRLARWQRRVSFPAWPYDDSVAALLTFYARCLLIAREATHLEFRWFWPTGYRAALILTHDVESAEGLRLAVEIADLEQERGLRSSFNIVADWYAVDRGILRELGERGFELGVHGIHHDHSMFSSRRGFEDALPKVASWAREIGAAGFRSPATHRVFDWLGELPLEYDCTIPHSDPYEPIPGGACTPWPFFIADVVELPYTLPQDHTLFTVLGDRTIDTWVRQVDRLEERFGLIQCVTHPDPGYLGDPRNRAHYIQLLEELSSREGIWAALPRDVARWWRERDSSDDSQADSRGLARMSSDGVVIEPAFDRAA
jgi:peptidoglycan/xylan/chitin deacetylase (PgdA/CDA1 family)